MENLGNILTVDIGNIHEINKKIEEDNKSSQKYIYLLFFIGNIIFPKKSFVSTLNSLFFL